jgi:hypothetical protein
LPDVDASASGPEEGFFALEFVGLEHLSGPLWGV